MEDTTDNAKWQNELYILGHEKVVQVLNLDNDL